jgi:pimeloyl-ACP methyl ester carboxylesterase
MPSIVFSHGNSFPASTYGVMLDSLRQRGWAVTAIENSATTRATPSPTTGRTWCSSWPTLPPRRKGRPGPAPILLGHSLGGILSLMCAAQRPELARAVVMLDSPVLGGWRASAVRGQAHRADAAPVASADQPPPARPVGRPRSRIPALCRQKVFARWDPQVLHDYVNHGTVDAEGTWRLAFDREVESRIYETIPHNLGHLLHRHPLKCPLAFVGALQSAEMKQVGGTDNTARLAKGRVTMIDGTHLFPMEKPLAAAAPSRRTCAGWVWPDTKSASQVSNSARAMPAQGRSSQAPKYISRRRASGFKTKSGRSQQPVAQRRHGPGSARRGLVVDRFLHRFVHGLALLRLRVVGRARLGPVGQGDNHQLALGVDEDALAEDAAGREAAVVVRPPLVAIAATGLVDIGLLGGGLLQPALGHQRLAAHLGAFQDELAKARVVAQGGLQAAAADLLAGLGQQPGGFLLHAHGLPDFSCRYSASGFLMAAISITPTRLVSPVL